MVMTKSATLDTLEQVILHDNGGVSEIELWIASHPLCRSVVILGLG